MIGCVGVYLAARTGFAEMWQADIPHLELLIALRFFIVIGISSVLAAYFYRKYGFLAAITLRLGDDLV